MRIRESENAHGDDDAAGGLSRFAGGSSASSGAGPPAARRAIASHDFPEHDGPLQPRPAATMGGEDTDNGAPTCILRYKTY